MWISLEDAKDRSPGKVEWWKIEKGPGGEVVDERQQNPDAPSDCPVRLYDGGNMHIGGWKHDDINDRYGTDGFGVHFFGEGEWFGNVCMGMWKKNRLNGPGREFWLPSSNTWIQNKIGTDAGGLPPHTYIGNYEDGDRNDPKAKIIFKDGTTYVGSWSGDEPEELEEILALFDSSAAATTAYGAAASGAAAVAPGPVGNGNKRSSEDASLEDGSNNQKKKRADKDESGGDDEDDDDDDDDDEDEDDDDDDDDGEDDESEE